MDERMLIATTSFFVEIEGKPVVVRKGETRVRQGHAVVAGREHLFDELPESDNIRLAEKPPQPDRGW
jgi:hypothetical protein